MRIYCFHWTLAYTRSALVAMSFFSCILKNGQARTCKLGPKNAKHTRNFKCAWINTAIIHTLLILLAGDIQLNPGPSETLQWKQSLSCRHTSTQRGTLRRRTLQARTRPRGELPTAPSWHPTSRQEPWLSSQNQTVSHWGVSVQEPEATCNLGTPAGRYWGSSAEATYTHDSQLQAGRTCLEDASKLHQV